MLTVQPSRSRALTSPLKQSTPALLGVSLMIGSSIAQATPFVISANGQEVTDSATGLIWRRCPEGMTWNGSICNNSATFYDHENALKRATSEASSSKLNWRLPNAKELETLLIENAANPALDVTAFPNTPNELFWSSTPYSGDSDGAWVVDFSVGVVGAIMRNHLSFVRLVR